MDFTQFNILVDANFFMFFIFMMCLSIEFDLFVSDGSPV